MLKFILKGVLRDKSRSLLPIIVVSIGVFLTVVLSAWMQGVFSDMLDMNAKYNTGHVKIMTRSFAENYQQSPNDLAILGVDELKSKLYSDYEDMKWVERINFGGLLDVPDENGETRAQGPAMARGVDLLSSETEEIDRLNIRKSIVKGELPTKRGQAIIANDFAEKFGVKIGDEVTIFGSTMYGSMMFQSFEVCATISFGTTILDRGAIIVDLQDAQLALDMDDAASEILGYFKSGEYVDEDAIALRDAFNKKYSDENDEFSPIMQRLVDQNGLEQYLAMANNASSVMVSIFIFAMSIVLWNTGLLGGLRRYSEYGVRLALGEAKGHIYKTIILEAVLIGTIGSIFGTIIGLGASWYLQNYGIDFSALTKNVSMMIPPVYRAKITADLYYVGFLPGLFAMTLGNALAGYSIYRRKTAQLFKELEV